MAFDGITIANLVHELKNTIEGGRISKIAQPETDELLLTIKTREGNFRLLLSASASLPLIYLTESNKNSPLTAPNFCMLLRKHIGSARIVSVTQPGLERVVNAMRVIAPELPFPIEYRELREPEEKLEINGYHITAYRVNHNVTCYGYAIEIPRAGKFDVERAKELGLPVRLWNPLQKGKQVEWEGEIYTPDMVMGPARRGIKIAYCTDSRPTERIVTNARGADLFICEGMYAEKEKLAKARQYKHMTFYEAAQMAKEAEVSELWLTHFSPSLTNPRSYMGEVRSIFPETYLGKDGKTKTLDFVEE